MTFEVGDGQRRELPLVDDVDRGAGLDQRHDAEVPAVRAGVVEATIFCWLRFKK
jgi:hypothetical protein